MSLCHVIVLQDCGWQHRRRGLKQVALKQGRQREGEKNKLSCLVGSVVEWSRQGRAGLRLRPHPVRTGFFGEEGRAEAKAEKTGVRGGGAVLSQAPQEREARGIFSV